MNSLQQQQPKTIQELMSGNPLIDAFMGGGPPLPRQQHPEAKVEAMLASIDESDDIEGLVSALHTDLKAIRIGTSSTRSYDVENENDHEEDQTKNQVHLDMLAARLARIKSLMYNERTETPSFARSFFSSSHESCAASDLLQSLLLNDERKMIFPNLLSSLQMIPFEARKDAASIFNYLLVCGCVLNESDQNIDEDRERVSSELYTKTMIGFVNYVDEYYEQIMRPIVQGHYLGDFTPSSSSSDEIKQKQDKNVDTETEVPTTPQPLKTVDVALHCGGMLRSTLRHPKLYSNLVTESNTPTFIFPFLDIFTTQANFEVASDALESLRLILSPPQSSTTPTSTPTPTLSDNLESSVEVFAASFLEREYDPIFRRQFNKLLSAKHANYITRRVSLQILSTILLTRTNYNVMIKYISDRSNLKTIMMLLRDSSAHITLEAFNVFKIFVVNPNKPEEIVRILADNKVKLVKYLTGLHQEKEKIDEQFKDEKTLVISTLQQLE